MTTQQLYLFNCLAVLITTVVAVLTRATLRRIAGASAGAAVCGVVMLGVVAFGERAGWWHMVMTWEPYFLTLFLINVALCGYVFLITWRIARRFGRRGLAVVVCVIAVLGPLRDSWYMATFPEWGSYAPGFAPMLAISGAYVLLGIIGHGIDAANRRAGRGRSAGAPALGTVLIFPPPADWMLFRVDRLPLGSNHLAAKSETRSSCTIESRTIVPATWNDSTRRSVLRRISSLSTDT